MTACPSCPPATERRLAVALAAILLLLPGPAAADTERAATHRDWVHRCEADGDAWRCRIETTLSGAAEAGAPEILHVRLEPDAHPLAATGWRLVVATPLPVFLPDQLRLELGALGMLTVPFRTCIDGRCEALMAVDEAVMAGLRREPEARVQLTLADGVTVRLGLSLMGFTAAQAALERGDLPPPSPVEEGGSDGPEAAPDAAAPAPAAGAQAARADGAGAGQATDPAIRATGAEAPEGTGTGDAADTADGAGPPPGGGGSSTGDAAAPGHGGGG